MKTTIGECTLDNIKIAFFDFDKAKIWDNLDKVREVYLEKIEPSYFIKNNYGAIVIKYDYLDKNIIEILHLATLMARFVKVFLLAEKVSEMEITFFRKKKIAGIISLNEIMNQDFRYVFNMRVSSFVSEDVMSNKSFSKSHTYELFKLSTSEIEILYLISKGLNNVEISNKIHKSYHTIKNHKSNIAYKTGIDSCRQLLSFALNFTGN